MYNLTLGQNDHFSQKHQAKKPCVFHDPCPLIKVNILLIIVDTLVKLNLLKTMIFCNVVATRLFTTIKDFKNNKKYIG
jgi:hypothetical protein